MTPRFRATRPNGYLPSLDGWRAIAILGVLMTHDLPWVALGHSNTSFRGYGGLGVNLFFAISGLLITTRILEEEELIGRFDVNRFYIRRFFRIQPAAVLYLSVVAILISAKVVHDGWRYWLGALFLYENFLWRGPVVVPFSYFVGHFWTLAVEEHFYILLSLLLFLIKRFRLAALLGIIVVLNLVTHYAVHHDLTDLDISDRRTYWQISYLLFPAALAVALRRPEVKRWAVRFWRPWTAFMVTAILLLLHRYAGQVHSHEGFGFPRHGWSHEVGLLSRFFFALWIVATMLHGRAWMTRLLEWRPLRWIGRISYSVYLWHVLFFFRASAETQITNPVILALSIRPVKYVAAFGVAALSYYFIEKPLMRLGHRLAPPATAGRPELADLPTEMPATQTVNA